MTSRSETVLIESAAELADQLGDMLARHDCMPPDRRGRTTCPVCALALAQRAAQSLVPESRPPSTGS